MAAAIPHLGNVLLTTLFLYLFWRLNKLVVITKILWHLRLIKKTVSIYPRLSNQPFFSLIFVIFGFRFELQVLFDRIYEIYLKKFRERKVTSTESLHFDRRNFIFDKRWKCIKIRNNSKIENLVIFNNSEYVRIITFSWFYWQVSKRVIFSMPNFTIHCLFESIHNIFRIFLDIQILWWEIILIEIIQW